MTSVLPPIPKLVFTVLEPLSLVAGFAAPFVSPEWFVASQIASSPLEAISPNARLVAYQLGNVYLLLALVGIAVLYTTTEARVVRNYIIALWIADVGHVGATYHVIGYERFVNVSQWNSMAWGNIGATAVLFSFRTAYLLGLFGGDRLPLVSPGKKKLR